MKNIVFILTAFISFTAFAAKGDETSIKGKMENAEGKTIYLEYFVNGLPVKLDSCAIGKKGKFEVSTTVSDPDFYRLGFGKDSFVLLVLKKQESVTLNGDAEDLNKSYSVSGSADSEKIKTFVAAINEYSDENLDINAKYNEPTTTQEERKELIKKRDTVKAAFIVKRDAFINANYNSLAALTALSHLHDMDDYDLIKKIADGMTESYKDSKFDTEMQKKMSMLAERKKQEEEAKAMREATLPGKIAPELNFENPDGEVITLESLRGNYVLIDFWASWCGPCRRENPNVVKAYNKYKDSGFTVYSVSLDKDKNRWLGAIKQDGLIWPNHVSDLKQWQSAAVKIYGFRGIPHTILIDKEGKIVQKDLRGPALEQKLKEIFGF